MRTLRIEIRLQRPACIVGPLHLDGILTAVHPCMHDQQETITRTGGRQVVAPLPLSVARLGGAWVWCASAWNPEQFTAMSALTRRRDAVDYLLTNKTVYPGSGPEKDMLRRAPLTHGPVVFFAAVPDGRGLKEVRRLLTGRVQQIGALRRAGYGVVDSIDISVVEGSPLRCLWHNGKAARRLPAGMLKTPVQPDRIAVIPPYWHAPGGVPAYEVGTPGLLVEGISVGRAKTPSYFP